MINFDDYQWSVRERLIRYAKIDTQSDMHSESNPSTEKQKNLGKVLLAELESMGLEAEMDETGQIYATIPSNTSKEVPTICFCSHMDTSPDAPGENVKPIVHENYAGGPIHLPLNNIKIDPEVHPNLKGKEGEDIITASGDTLLGADNKAGLAAIMDAAQYLLDHPEIKHGRIRLLFTCDEEIGRGTDGVDMDKLDAKYGYTVDGEAAGSLENETFSADMITFKFKGVSSHTGYAKDKMVNAGKVASTFVASLPDDYLSPETTEGREPFFHPLRISGSVEEATVTFLLRSFVTSELDDQANMLKKIAGQAIEKWPGSTFETERVEQYRNMKDILDQHPLVIENAEEAIRRVGLKPNKRSIRGGTDGSKLTHMGLPCPNIFAGEQAFHSPFEWVSVQDMEKSAQMIVHLAALWEEKS